MKYKNTNLYNARTYPNDEFYTQYIDIEKECQHYVEHFSGRWLYLPCDTEDSNFWKYFVDHFNEYGLKRLTATHINLDGTSSYRLDYNGTETLKTALNGNGDFMSEECSRIKDECDIVITNPPFSLFKEFIIWLDGKKFLIIGNINGIIYKEVFPLIKDNKIWLGISKRSMEFIVPDDRKKVNVNSVWYTNLDHKKRHKVLELTKTYNPTEYPRYDNYSAIEVGKVKDIPKDYDGVMGVPITFIDKYNPQQFEIVYANEHSDKISTELTVRPRLNGRLLYRRMLIKNKDSLYKK